MFLGMQDFDFAQNLIKFPQILITFAQISPIFCSNFTQILPQKLSRSPAFPALAALRLGFGLGLYLRC